MKARNGSEYLILAMPLVLLIVFIVIPVAGVIIKGFLDGGTSFIDAVTSPVNRFTISFTIIQATISTALSVAIGLPGGYLLARLRFPGKKLVKALLIIPFVLPPIVVVVGFIQMFGSYGVLDSMAMLLLGAESSIIDLASGIPGILLAHTFYNAPFVILLVSAALERLNPELEEAADILGASTLQKLRRVVIPHALPSILAASILVFLFCFMSFPIVLAFGNGIYRTIEVQIWNAFRWADFGEASSLALIQICITITLAISYVIVGKRSANEAGHTASIKTMPLSKYGLRSVVGIALYMVGILFLVAGPIIAIGRAAFYDPIRGIYTLDGFSYILTGGTDGGLLPLINSLYYASIATFLAVLLGIPLAYAAKSRSRTVSSMSNTLVLLPLGVSSLTIAYGLVSIIAVPTGLNINPWPIIVVAQTVIGLPFSARAIEISLRSIDETLIEQADSLGVSRLQRLFFVEIPLLMPGILVGGIFAFAMAIGEMSATLLIALPQNYTLAVAIYDRLGVRAFVEAGAAALILVILCVAAFVIMEHISEGSVGGTI